MIRGRFVFVALILLAAVTAPAANAFDAAGFPPEVREALKYAHEECGEGGKVTFAPDTVRKLDLTGDGRPDYIVDFRDTQCAERLAVYCGTGGCSMDILVTLPDGKIRTVFSARTRSFSARVRCSSTPTWSSTPPPTRCPISSASAPRSPACAASGGPSR